MCAKKSLGNCNFRDHEAIILCKFSIRYKKAKLCLKYFFPIRKNTIQCIKALYIKTN